MAVIPRRPRGVMQRPRPNAGISAPPRIPRAPQGGAAPIDVSARTGDPQASGRGTSTDIDPRFTIETGQPNDMGALRAAHTAQGTTTAAEAPPPAASTTPPPNSIPRAPQSLEQLQAARQRAIQEIHRRGGRGNAQGFSQRLRDIDAQIRGLRNPAAPPAAETPAAETPPPAAETPAPEETAPETGGPVTAAPEADTSALFPNTRAFLPENFEGSPLYKFQRDQGSKALERLMSARGLTGSGAEIEGNARFLNEVGAREADRLQRMSETEADRLERIQNNEANRLTNREDTQFNRAMEISRLLSEQNPIRYANDAYNKEGELTLDRGKGRGQFATNDYRRVSAGGGGAPPPFVPPFPNSPDFSIADMLGAGAGGNNRKNIGSSIMDLLAGFL